MIKKIHKLIAFHLSLFLLFISFGLLKPNFNGAPTASNPLFKNKSEISKDINEDPNKESTE